LHSLPSQDTLASGAISQLCSLFSLSLMVRVLPSTLTKVPSAVSSFFSARDGEATRQTRAMTATTSASVRDIGASPFHKTAQSTSLRGRATLPVTGPAAPSRRSELPSARTRDFPGVLGRGVGCRSRFSSPNRELVGFSADNHGRLFERGTLSPLSVPRPAAYRNSLPSKVGRLLGTHEQRWRRQTAPRLCGRTAARPEINGAR